MPTVNWADEASFDFCFEGITRGSVVAVSTYQAHAHSTCNEQKEWFLKGYKEMLRRIEPSVIICYSTPFTEMQGNIVHVDYELSSWKHDEDDVGKAAAEPSEGIRIVKHTGCVIFDDFFTSKGGGSAREGGGMREYPGNDPNKAPPGFEEWRGKPPEGGDKGAWYNKDTGESLHPNLDHGPPEGPHWDYNDGMYGHFRIWLSL